jgi:hypothetical protein
VVAVVLVLQFLPQGMVDLEGEHLISQTFLLPAVLEHLVKVTLEETS